MSSMKFIDLFAGIGGTRIAFEPYGECVYSCEIDEDAREAYQRNWGDEPTETDIRNIENPSEEIPDHDILLACWPCPSFSQMGKEKGFDDDRGILFYEIVDILKAKKPKAFMLENVKNLRHIKDGAAYEAVRNELKDADYRVFGQVLNALDFGVPQHRERLIIVGFRDDVAPNPDEFSIPEKNEDALTTENDQRDALADLLESDPDEKYEASEKIKQDRREAVDNPEEVPEPSVWHENRSGSITPRPYSSALRASSSWNYLLINGERLPTVRERLRFQGFPKDFTIDESNRSRARRLTGNTVPVPMVQAVADALLDELGFTLKKDRKEILAGD